MDIAAVDFEAVTFVPHGHRRWFSKKALSLAFVLLRLHSFSWIIHHRECFSIESRGVHLQIESALIPQLLKRQRFEQVSDIGHLAPSQLLHSSLHSNGVKLSLFGTHGWGPITAVHC